MILSTSCSKVKVRVRVKCSFSVMDAEYKLYVYRRSVHSESLDGSIT